MRVLHVIPASAPRYGGPSTAVLAMCRALQDRSVDTVLVTTDADGPERLPVPLGLPTTCAEVKTIFFPRGFSEGFKYSPLLARWLRANVARFDLVHIHAVFSHASLAAARVCRRTGTPYIVRPLGSLTPFAMRQKPFRKRVLWYSGVRRMLGQAAALMYNTERERRLSEARVAGGRSVVIPLGVDQCDQSAGAGEQTPVLPYVLVLGRLHPVKGLPILLDAFLKLAETDEFKGWHLAIAGDGDARFASALRRQVRKLDGDRQVSFLGWVDGSIKAGLINSAALLAQPSREESFGLSVAEAMAAGIPVLVSENVGLADDVQRAGAGWVAPLGPEPLRRALEAILRDPGERARRGAAGKKLVDSCFTWPIVAEQLERLYKSALAH